MIFFGWFILSILVGAWANNKGRSGVGFFFLALLLSPLVGFIVVALSKPNTKLVEGRQIVEGSMRKCPFCAELVKAEAIVCRYCNRDLPAQTAAAATDTRPRNIDGVPIG